MKTLLSEERNAGMLGVESCVPLVSEAVTVIASLSLYSPVKECLFFEKQIEKAEMTDDRISKRKLHFCYTKRLDSLKLDWVDLLDCLVNLLDSLPNRKLHQSQRDRIIKNSISILLSYIYFAH